MKECGSCRACCFRLAVPSIQKERKAPCPNVNAYPDKGCGNYELRPEECRAYACGWLVDFEGEMPNAMRPDQSGIMISPTRYDSKFQQDTGIVLISAHELRPKAAEQYWGQKLLARLSRKHLIGLDLFHGAEIFMGPSDKVAVVTLWMAQNEWR